MGQYPKKGQNKDISVGKVQNTPYYILVLDIKSVLLVGRHVVIVRVISQWVENTEVCLMSTHVNELTVV
jgi:hypothetical protein